MSVASFTAGLLDPSPMHTASEISVRQSPYTASQKPGRSGQLNPAARTDVGERVVAFLRQRHPTKTPDSVSAETGVPAGTVQKWIDRGSAPNVVHFCRLVSAYGPDFLAIAFANSPAWLDHAVREERAATLKAEIAAREAQLARL